MLCGLRVSTGQVQPDVRPGYLYVEFAERDVQISSGKTGYAIFDEVAARYGVQSIEKAFPFLDVVAANRTLTPEAESLRNIYKANYTGPYAPTLVASELSRDPAVVLAEPQPLYRVTREGNAIPNDARYDRQREVMERHQFPDAWDVVKGEQGSALIAVVDEGTFWQHEDLRDNLWTNPNEIPNNGVDDDGNGFVDDVHGWNFRDDGPDVYGNGVNASHGTAVSGAANAVTDNSIGIAGAAWNAKLVPIHTGCRDSEFFCFTDQGVMYAAIIGADIINCSFGGSVSSETSRRVYEAAFAEGALTVAAAGNEGMNVDSNPSYPSGYRVNLSVGGTSGTSDTNIFNYGRTVNVFAPGRFVNVTSPNNGYGASSGTSFAAPLTAGLAALVKTAFPNFSPGQIREQIRMTAESIDEANPSLQGRMGRGRINAVRAVTENVRWAVRLTNASYTNQDGSDKIVSGDQVGIRATFENVHGDASDISIALRTNESYMRSLSEPVAVASLARGDSVTLEFMFQVTSNAPSNRRAELFTEINDGVVIDTPDLIHVKVNQNKSAMHETPALRVSVTSEGNIGYTAFQGDLAGQGVGFRPLDRNGNERDPLFEGGLIIGRGNGRISDCVRGIEQSIQEDDFALVSGGLLELFSPGDLTSQQSRVELADDPNDNGAGVRIVQESYTDNASDHEDFVVIKYTIRSTQDRAYDNLHAGLFFDWDVNSADPVTDEARFDPTLGTGWIADESGSLHVGTYLLTDQDKLNYRAISNPQEIYDGYGDDEKWAHLTGGISQVTLNPTDLSQVTSVGPLSIRPEESVVVAFAVVAGTSESDYLENVGRAQLLWDNVINSPGTSTAPPEEFPTWDLTAMYPNPSSGPVIFEMDSPAGSHVELDVHDLLGRRVATVFAGRPGSPVHRIRWDPRGESGQALAGGMYFVRLSAYGEGLTFQQTYPLVLLR